MNAGKTTGKPVDIYLNGKKCHEAKGRGDITPRLVFSLAGVPEREYNRHRIMQAVPREMIMPELFNGKRGDDCDAPLKYGRGKLWIFAIDA